MTIRWRIAAAATQARRVAARGGAAVALSGAAFALSGAAVALSGAVVALSGCTVALPLRRRCCGAIRISRRVAAVHEVHRKY